ncbi:hypothetical protein EYC80_008680 [Monilinia laxa]|uniref:Uncharacterized protein n=1 Tax=Monilinia laxa TaxID=61186 RepID=A0A5N6K1H2_MONLA|nr:hypothetical protein EYC80_008680 [Monilinia laxa]
MDFKVDLDVEGKVAIITGAASGICLALATLLLSKGCNVVIADLALQPSASELLTTYTRTSTAATPSTSSSSSATVNPIKRPQCLFHPTDVTSWPDLTALFEYTLSNFPSGIDIIIPGAGLFDPLSSNFYNPPGSPLLPRLLPPLYT